MSVSDNSTVVASRDIDGSEPALDEHSYGDGDLTPVLYGGSPYADTMITLQIGPDAVPFPVHSPVLFRSPVLEAKRNVTKQHIHLPELDQATTHTLVHYLYTNTYQSLPVPGHEPKITTLSYKLGTCVYCAAVRFQLQDLAELAKEQIIFWGEKVDIIDILALARDQAFPFLSENEAWYLEYLEGAIRSAMKTNPEPFKQPGFITQVEGNTRLLQIVWKTVMSSYTGVSDAPTAVPKEEATPIVDPPSSVPVKVTIQTKEGKVSSRSKNASIVSDAESFATAESTTEKVSKLSPVPGSLKVVTLKLDDIEPTIETPQAPEPFTDEIDFRSSKTYQTQQLGQKTESPSGTQGLLLDEPARSGHKRVDSMMQVEEAEKEDPAQEVVSGEEEDKAVEKLDAASLVANDSNEVAGVSKKDRKRNKKKKNATLF